MDGDADPDVLLARRLRGMRAVCAALLACVAAGAGFGGWWLTAGAAPRRAGATDLSLTLSFLAMVLILVASRLQSVILRRAGGGPFAVSAAGALDSYRHATLLAFALLAAAALLGLPIAWITGSPRYAWVLGAAGVLGMLVRWPRRSAAARLAGLRARPPGPLE
jgi:hypothetical protein